MEIKTEQRFPAEHAQQWKFCFQLIWIFRLGLDVHHPFQHAHIMTLPIQTFKVSLPKIGDHVISSCIRGGFQGLAFPYFIVNQGPC
jgi:hypothetical protein